jgi:hypothetical protein
MLSKVVKNVLKPKFFIPQTNCIKYQHFIKKGLHKITKYLQIFPTIITKYIIVLPIA